MRSHIRAVLGQDALRTEPLDAIRQHAGLSRHRLVGRFDDRAMPVALQIVGHPAAISRCPSRAADASCDDWHARVPTGILDLVEFAHPR